MLSYALYKYFFERRGWKRYRLPLCGTRWTSPDAVVTDDFHEAILSAKGFLLDGKPVAEQAIIDLLQIPQREVMMYEELRRLGHTGRWAQVFLDGVRWADAHPLTK